MRDDQFGRPYIGSDPATGVAFVEEIAVVIGYLIGSNEALGAKNDFHGWLLIVAGG
jgi:hypothetical protein